MMEKGTPCQGHWLSVHLSVFSRDVCLGRLIRPRSICMAFRLVLLLASPILSRIVCARAVLSLCPMPPPTRQTAELDRGVFYFVSIRGDRQVDLIIRSTQ